jgi:hypothetical protein
MNSDASASGAANPAARARSAFTNAIARLAKDLDGDGPAMAVGGAARAGPSVTRTASKRKRRDEDVGLAITAAVGFIIVEKLPVSISRGDIWTSSAYINLPGKQTAAD